MTIIKNDDPFIFESPDGGKTIYKRKPGESVRVLHSIDPEHLKDQEVQKRWHNLKEAFYMAQDDVTLNDAIEKVEILYALKKEER